MATEHLRASAPERARRAAAPFFFARRAQRRRGWLMGLPAPEHVRDRRRRLRERPQAATGEHGSGIVGGALVGAANNVGRSDIKRERCQAAKQRAQRYHPALRRAVTRRACADARKQPAPARARAVPVPKGRPQAAAATRRSYLGWATTAVKQILNAGGAFAGYCRASLAAPTTRAAKDARVVSKQLLPLPLQSLLQLPGRMRSRHGYRRWAEAQATRSLALLSGLALNWEATGRP